MTEKIVEKNKWKVKKRLTELRGFQKQNLHHFFNKIYFNIDNYCNKDHILLRGPKDDLNVDYLQEVDGGYLNNII